MDNQHRKIAGYRELSQAEIDLMNEIKALGPQLQAMAEKIDWYLAQQRGHAEHMAAHENDVVELGRLQAANPGFWAGSGRSSAQAALMFWTRAIAQPTFF
jgi:hypothetical protein